MNSCELAVLLERASKRDTSALIDFDDWPDFLAMIRDRALLPKSVEGFMLSDGRQDWQGDVLLHLSAKELESGVDPFELIASFLKQVDVRDRDLKLLIIPVAAKSDLGG